MAWAALLRLLGLLALVVGYASTASAHGIGFTNTRIWIDPASVATLTNRPLPGITPTDDVSFIMSVDTASDNGPVGYYTIYVPDGATVVNAQFVDANYATVPASAPTGMPDGYGPRGVRTWGGNWPPSGIASSSTMTNATMGSVAVLAGDTGIFYSTAPSTALYGTYTNGIVTTNVPGLTIKTTSQLMGIVATHNLWDADQTKAFGAGTKNAAANQSTAPVINQTGNGTTPFGAGSAVAGPDVGYPLDNTGQVGPWNRVSYAGSYSTKGVPNAAAPVTVAGVVNVVGVPTLAGAAFPLPANTNTVRYALGAPRVPGTYYVRITFRFNQVALDHPNGVIINSEATGADADGINNGQDNVWRYHQPSATTTAGVPASQALFLAKEIIAVNGVPVSNPALIDPGSTVTYRITYMNTAGLPLNSVVLSDVVPQQISSVCANISNVSINGVAASVSNTCPAPGGTVTFPVLSKLRVGEGGRVEFDLKIAQTSAMTASTPVTVTNTARLSSAEFAAGNFANVVTALRLPDLRVSKSHAGDFRQGQIGAAYTVTVSNLGNATTTAPVTVSDAVPTGLTATAASGTGWACTVGATTTCTRADPLGAGLSYPPIELLVNVASTAPLSLTNVASVSGGGEINNTNNSAADPTRILANSDLTISKTHVGNFFQGQNGATYSLAVANIGGANTVGTVTVVDILPVGLSFVAAAGTGFSCAATGLPATGQTITCTRTTALNAASSVPIRLTVNVALDAATPLSNVASVSGGAEVNTTNNSSTDVTVIMQRPVASKSFTPSAVLPGGTALLSITLTNPNASTVTGLAFTDTYPSSPAGLRNAAVPGGANTCGGTRTAAADGTVLALTGGSIAPNSSCSVSVIVVGASAVAASYLNSSGPISSTNSGVGLASTATLTVVVPVAPSIAKSFTPNPVESTFPSTLKITLSNPNLVTISGVAFDDIYPVPSAGVAGLVNSNTPAAALTAASLAAGCQGSITGGVAGGGAVGLTGAVMPPGVTCELTVQVVPPTTNIGNYTVTNVTSAVTSTNNGVAVTGASATALLSVMTPAPPHIAKAFQPASVPVNEVSTLTFTLTNPNASRALTGVAFSDTYPSGLVNAPAPGLLNTCGGTITGAAPGGDGVGISGVSLTEGQSCTLSLMVQSASPGSYVNTSGAISSTTPDAELGNSASATLVVTPKPSITKSFLPASVLVEAPATLRLVISNSSSSPALSNLGFTDNFPLNLVIANPNNLVNSCGGTAEATPGSALLSLTGGTLASGASCTLDVAVSSATPGTYANTASGVTANEFGAPGSPSNTANLLVLAKPSIAKSFAPVFVVAGGTSTLTLTIQNPNHIALNALAFTDNFPANLLIASQPNVQNTCAGTVLAAAGGSSVALSGASTLAANQSCTVRVNVSSNQIGAYLNTSGGVASSETGSEGSPSNGATVNFTTPGVPVSGFVYHDLNHNLQKDGGETGTALVLYAKLVAASGGTVLQATAVDPSTGAYTFAAVPVGEYSIIIDDNSVLADAVASVPATWIGTQQPQQIRSNVVVGTSAVQNINFGLYFGNVVTGRVFNDAGIAGGVANNGIQDGGEAGLNAVVVKLTNASGATTYEQTTTDANGNYTLWIPGTLSGSALKIVQTNRLGYLSTGGNSATPGASYDRALDSFSFVYSGGTQWSGLNFGDVLNNTLVNHQLQNVAPGSVAFLPHVFTANSAGTVVFETYTQAGWPQSVLRDNNCNGVIESGESILLGGVNLVAGEKLCVLVRVSVPAGVAVNTQDVVTLFANFSYANATPSIGITLSNNDLLVVGTAAGGGLILVKSLDNATPRPGDTIVYTIAYTNNGAGPLSNILLNDSTSLYTSFVSAGCLLPLPASLTACTVTTAPAPGGAGAIVWTLGGSLQPGATGSVNFSVQINP